MSRSGMLYCPLLLSVPYVPESVYMRGATQQSRAKGLVSVVQLPKHFLTVGRLPCRRAISVLCSHRRQEARRPSLSRASVLRAIQIVSITASRESYRSDMSGLASSRTYRSVCSRTRGVQYVRLECWNTESFLMIRARRSALRMLRRAVAR